VINQY